MVVRTLAATVGLYAGAKLLTNGINWLEDITHKLRRPQKCWYC